MDKSVVSTSNLRTCYVIDTPEALNKIIKHDFEMMGMYEIRMETLKKGDLFTLVESEGTPLTHSALITQRLEDGYTIQRALEDATVSNGIPGVKCVPVLVVHGKDIFFMRHIDFDDPTPAVLVEIIRTVSSAEAA